MSNSLAIGIILAGIATASGWHLTQREYPIVPLYRSKCDWSTSAEKQIRAATAAPRMRTDDSLNRSLGPQ